MVFRCPAVHLDDDIAAMRAGLGGAIASIPRPAGFQRANQRCIPIPATAVDQCDRLVEQSLADRRQRYGQARQIGLALLSQGFAASRELLLPGREILVAAVLFERGIPLAQRLVIAAPVVEERVFHVEHAPVEESPPPAGPLL